MSEHIDVIMYLDPGCPMAWGTSRWLRAVARARPVRPHWHSLSILQRDGDVLPDSAPPHVRAMSGAARKISHRLLRVFEALRADGREPDIDALYLAWGTEVFSTWPPTAPPGGRDVAAILSKAGLDKLIPELDNERWDPVIAGSLDSARQAVGGKPISPTIQIAGHSAAFTGPVFALGTGPSDAVAVWDAVSALIMEPNFVELARPIQATRPA